MGILDEAIREHLALKRRQGLSDDELRRLEDEAFGPPARPGEPDFPEEDGKGEGGSVDEHDEKTRVQQLADSDDGEGTPRDEAQGEPALEEASGQPSLEGAEVEPMDAGEDEDLEALAERDSSERSEPEGGAPLYDFAQELEQPKEGADAEGPIESLETVEHSIDEESPSDEQAVEEPPSDEQAVEEPLSDEQAVEPPSDEYSYEPESDEYESSPRDEAEGGGDEDDEDDDDVLEETPDFLRDAPEDDELWFEQGEPKDFDF